MTAKGFGFFMLLLLGLFLVSLFFGHNLDSFISAASNRIHTMISDPNHQINLWPPLSWMVMFFLSLVSRYRGIDPLLLFLGMVVFVFIALIAVWNPSVRQVALWRVLNTGGLGLTFMALGLYDHIRLLVALPRHEERQHD